MFPTTSAPSLETWQMRFNGLTTGPGTPYGLKSSDFATLPNVRSGDSARSRAHGELAGLDLLSGRDIVLAGNVQADSTSVMHAVGALAAAFAPALPIGPLWVDLPTLGTLGTMCRVRKRNIPLDLDFYAAGVGRVSMLLHSTDPRLYGAPQSASCGLGTPLGGLTFPVTFPASFGGGSVAGVINADNAGGSDMLPILIITGPCTNPTVENATTGWSLSFSNPLGSGYTLNAGDTLTVDTDLQTITYLPSGTTTGQSRANWLVAGSTWPNPIAPVYGLAVGNNVLQFTSSDATTVAGTLTAQWANAYLL